MQTIRLYTPQRLTVHDEVSLDDSTRHRATHVLRIHKHSPLVLFNGDGYDYPGQPVTLHRKAMTVRITERTPARDESSLETHLVLGVSKGTHMDFAIQKTVEAGVSEIHPVITERTVTRFSDQVRAKRQQHWQNIIISACEQCGRAVLPVLHEARDLGNLHPLSKDARGFVLDMGAGNKLAHAAQNPVEKVWLVIGPEGGLTGTETEQVIAKGFEAVSLGPRILRTETAALTALVGAQLLWGDLSAHDNG
ncbi:MAG: 16S rRNA (uracil(1498)-N(3))-methyltransferase [Proteobacteria bacterium]|nr:16S rRNA (uracil(1498)-N(3))-methyltransferase [Pseudomonadota bacterium]